MALRLTAIALMVQLVSSQEADDSCLVGGNRSDDASFLQVSTGQAPSCEWKLSAGGGSCQLKCAENGKVCDRAQQRALQGAALVAQVAALGWTCKNAPLDANDVVNSDLAPYIVGTTISGTTGQCKSSGAASDSKCGRKGGSSVRVCCCVPQGSIQDDPHIRTLRNEFYTLLKSGNFLAWSFSKAPVDWRLYAAYSGPRAKFTTQSLLLVESQSGQTLEFTADACAWQMKTESGWRPVQPQVLSSLEVEEVNTVTDDPLSLESVISLKMPSQNGARNVARVLTHCSPQNHVNFLVKMFDSNDLEYAGGELGSIQDPSKGHVSFLSTKLKSMTMKTDDEFEVLGTWASLGGSEAATKFLESRQEAGAMLLSTSGEACTEAQEQEAEKICAKHLEKDGIHAEIFTNCVFDVCHGGGEADALSAAAFITAGDN
ncbi:ATG18A [Symbiodinium natans]|uniref:ATG18A protein n=1 Tax=Symbiodinium natans TaxID=878477 RepID=A0A812PMI2_9DINO|nr:ATG18A [Symbiodinium natans]